MSLNVTMKYKIKVESQMNQIAYRVPRDALYFMTEYKAEREIIIETWRNVLPWDWTGMAGGDDNGWWEV